MANVNSRDRSATRQASLSQFIDRLEQKVHRSPAEPPASTGSAPASAAPALSQAEKRLRALEHSFRSFCKGTVVVGNLSGGNYYCWQRDGSHWNLAPASDLMEAVANRRLEAKGLEEMIREKISQRLVETLRQTTHPDAPGLLLLMLSSSPSQRESEFSTFHSTLKDRYGVDSSAAQLVKLYPATPPLQSRPSGSVLTVRCGLKAGAQHLSQLSKRVTLLNFSELGFKYMRAFERHNEDELIAPLLLGKPDSPAEFAAQFGQAVAQLLHPQCSARASIEKTLANHGILLLFLPCNARFQALAHRIFSAGARDSNLDLSSARGGVMLFSESITSA